MEEAVKILLQSAVEYGAGYIIAGLSVWLYIAERKALLKEREAHIKTLDRVIELSSASISSDKDTTAALATLTRVLDSVDRRLESSRTQDGRIPR